MGSYYGPYRSIGVVFKILAESGTAPFHSGIEEGPLPTPHTGVPRFDRHGARPPSIPQLFFEQFQHCCHNEVSALSTHFMLPGTAAVLWL